MLFNRFTLLLKHLQDLVQLYLIVLVNSLFNGGRDWLGFTGFIYRVLLLDCLLSILTQLLNLSIRLAQSFPEKPDRALVELAFILILGGISS